jgi:hypothetical protein
MTLGDWLEQAKKKPYHVRRRYAIVGLCISMVFVVLLWSITWSVTPSTTPNNATRAQNKPVAPTNDFSFDDLMKQDKVLDLRQRIDEAPNPFEGLQAGTSGVEPYQASEGTTTPKPEPDLFQEPQ